MKISDIKVGGFYHDKKLGVREVLSIGLDEAGMHRAEYRILAAKVMQEYRYDKKKMVSVIDSVTSCHLASFAAWSKVSLTKAECDDLLALLSAKRIKLAPGEAAFMTSVAEEFIDGVLPANTGVEVSFNFDEMRAAKNVAKKGFVVVNDLGDGRGGVIALTNIGAAWIRSHLAQDKTRVEQQEQEPIETSRMSL